MGATYEYRQKKPKDIEAGQKILIEFVDRELRPQMESAVVLDIKALNPARYLVEYRRIDQRDPEKLYVSSRSTLKVLT